MSKPLRRPLSLWLVWFCQQPQHRRDVHGFFYLLQLNSRIANDLVFIKSSQGPFADAVDQAIDQSQALGWLIESTDGRLQTLPELSDSATSVIASIPELDLGQWESMRGSPRVVRQLILAELDYQFAQEDERLVRHQRSARRTLPDAPFMLVTFSHVVV